MNFKLFPFILAQNVKIRIQNELRRTYKTKITLKVQGRVGWASEAYIVLCEQKCKNAKAKKYITDQQRESRAEQNSRAEILNTEESCIVCFVYTSLLVQFNCQFTLSWVRLWLTDRYFDPVPFVWGFRISDYLSVCDVGLWNCDGGVVSGVWANKLLASGFAIFYTFCLYHSSRFLLFCFIVSLCSVTQLLFSVSLYFGFCDFLSAVLCCGLLIFILLFSQVNVICKISSIVWSLNILHFSGVNIDIVEEPVIKLLVVSFSF